MDGKMQPAITGFVVAVVITTIMDATGYSVFSALPLIPLTGLCWYLQKLDRTEIGLVWGPLKAYWLALAYPLGVLGLIALIAVAAGAIDTSETEWDKSLINIALLSSTGVLMVMITEEGFFRGWLWAALKRAGKSDHYVLIWTSLAFAAWHISAISLDTGFDVPAREIPIYLLNATILGLVWGMLRMATGSIVVAAVCHSVWNGLDYPLFGFGEKVGALGIHATHIFGPEVGIVGVAINAAAAWLLYARLIWNRK